MIKSWQASSVLAGSSKGNRVRLIEEALHIALALPINWFEINHPVVMHLALEFNVTTCDVCYLYVARKAGILLVTFDETLEKASRIG